MRARTRHLAKRRFLVATKRLKYYVRRYRHRSNPARRPGAGSRSLIGLPVSVDVIHARSLLPPACETTATTTVVVKMKNEKPIGRTRRARNRTRTTPKNLEIRLRPVVCARDGTDRWRRTDETTPRRVTAKANVDVPFIRNLSRGVPPGHVRFPLNVRGIRVTRVWRTN